MCTGWLQAGWLSNLEDQNLCMFKALLAKSELQRPTIRLLIVWLHFCCLDTRFSSSHAYTVRTYSLFKCSINAHAQTPLLRWKSLPTLLASPTRLPTTPSPSPALPLFLREWSHQRHSLGEGGLGHQRLA